MQTMKLALSLTFISVVLYSAACVFAQGTPVTRIVSVSECQRCRLPTPPDPCCEAYNAVCKRLDYPAKIEDEGHLTVLTQLLVCDNCCKYTPSTCDPNPDPKECNELAFDWIEWFEPHVASRLVDYIDEVKDMLAAEMPLDRNALIHEVLFCPMTVPKCKKYERTAMLVYQASVVTSVKHGWMVQGTWWTSLACQGQVPPAECKSNGKEYFVVGTACYSALSRAIGDVYGWSDCGAIDECECPPPEPCS